MIKSQEILKEVAEALMSYMRNKNLNEYEEKFFCELILKAQSTDEIKLPSEDYCIDLIEEITEKVTTPIEHDDIRISISQALKKYRAEMERINLNR